MNEPEKAPQKRAYKVLYRDGESGALLSAWNRYAGQEYAQGGEPTYALKAAWEVGYGLFYFSRLDAAALWMYRGLDNRIAPSHHPQNGFELWEVEIGETKDPNRLGLQNLSNFEGMESFAAWIESE
ncbi:MAG: hypothetical protein PHO89_11730, partial [Methylacidiphilaceae bacterium]|nr:hypothetical protein [Candidatus Methylacidiphilaceae bacterium]